MERKWYHGNVNAKTASRYILGQARIEEPGIVFRENKPVFSFTVDLEASSLSQICGRVCGYEISDFNDVKALLRRADETHSSRLEGKLVDLYVNKEGKIEGISL